MKLKFISVWSLFQYPTLFSSPYFATMVYSHISISVPPTREKWIFVTKIKIWTRVLVLSNALTPLYHPKRCSFHLGNLWVGCKGSFADTALKKRPWKRQIFLMCISCCLWLLCSWFGVAVFSFNFHPIINGLSEYL